MTNRKSRSINKNKNSSTQHLLKARQNKKDEFYTMYEDIEKELSMYDKEVFKDKTIFLNCDNYQHSQFFQYFKDKYDELGVKEVHALHRRIQENDSVYHTRLTRDKNTHTREFITDVEGITDGDFREEYSLKLLEEADLVVTNPPFSLVREFITLLEDYKKPFLIIASQNTVTYKEVYPLITDGSVRTGVNSGTMKFLLPEEYKDNKNAYLDEKDGNYYQSLGNIIWLTTLQPKVKREKLKLTHTYEDDPDNYPKYYNLDAIEVSKVAEIPKDYKGLMGVPITYLNKHNPEQFEVLGHARDEQFIIETPRLRQFRHNKDTGKTVSTKGDLYRPLKTNEKQPMLSYKDEDDNIYRRVYSRYIIRAV